MTYFHSQENRVQLQHSDRCSRLCHCKFTLWHWHAYCVVKWTIVVADTDGDAGAMCTVVYEWHVMAGTALAGQCEHWPLEVTSDSSRCSRGHWLGLTRIHSRVTIILSSAGLSPAWLVPTSFLLFIHSFIFALTFIAMPTRPRHQMVPQSVTWNGTDWEFRPTSV